MLKFVLAIAAALVCAGCVIPSQHSTEYYEDQALGELLIAMQHEQNAEYGEASARYNDAAGKFEIAYGSGSDMALSASSACNLKSAENAERAGKTNLAIERYELAAKSGDDPAAIAALYRLGLLHEELEDLDAAQDAFRRALQKIEGQPRWKTSEQLETAVRSKLD